MIGSDFTLLFVAPFYNRSGYGQGARSLLKDWLELNIPVRIHAVDNVEQGIDDCDINLLRSLENTPFIGRVILVIYHVPTQLWLDIKLPPNAIRIMFTTFEGAVHGDAPPLDWVRICNNMDLVFLSQFSEVEPWCRAGLNSTIVRMLKVLPGWVNNKMLPQPSFGQKQNKFRFLTIAMYQPRRRWDALFEAFYQEFVEEPNVELYVKVNYPAWHPVPGQPRKDLLALLEKARKNYPSAAKIILDEEVGTRKELCAIIDSSSCYISTDVMANAPTSESLVRGRHVIVPKSQAGNYPPNAVTIIEEDPDYIKLIDQEIRAYQPHITGTHRPLLRTTDIRKALRSAFSDENITLRSAWEGWHDWIGLYIKQQADFNDHFLAEIQNVIREKNKTDLNHTNIRWEGSQFVYHSLAHVNREICKGLLDSKQVKLSIIPYEQDTFDPRSSMQSAIPLMWCVRAPLERTDVHVRHQWPPNFSAPSEGAWVMIQPWEYGGIPLEWVTPMRDLVDEIWVPTSWVRDCYIKSGLPDTKVHVIPNGVDIALFHPVGDHFPLETKKSFKLLYVGGLIQRKGFDLVVNAYLRAFKKTDDVCLVIKGAGGTYGPETEFVKFLEEIRKSRPDMPEIEYVSAALTEAQIASIYRSCDVLVHPYRGEGFGLPIAEAMASGLSVIVTKNGAASDFVRPEFSYLITSTKKGTQGDHGFEPAAPGFWLEEPNIEVLIASMHSAFTNQIAVKQKGLLARSYAEKNLTWDIAVKKIIERAHELSTRTPIRFITKQEAILIEVNPSSPAWLEATIISIKELQRSQSVVFVFLVKEEDRPQFSEEFFYEEFSNAYPNLIGSQLPLFKVVDSVEKFLEVARCFVFNHRKQKFVSPSRVSGDCKTVAGTHHQNLTAFIFEADWAMQNWTEILISYLVEFRYAESVALVFPIKSSDLSFVNVNIATEMISAILSQTGDTQFPDIIVIDTVTEMYEVAKKYDFQWVDSKEGSTIGLSGRVGHRLGKSRLLLQAAKEGGS